MTVGPADRSRLEEPPSDLMAEVAFGEELRSYPELWRWMSIADIAHVQALAAAGVLDPAVEHKLLRALVELHPESQPRIDPRVGDLYSNRHRFLRARIGNEVEEMTAGRARREVTTIAWHLETRFQIERARSGVQKLAAALVGRAEQSSDVVMPDFTYLQHAHPTTLAHYLLAFAYPFLRDIERLTIALESVNRSPAGSGSVNGSRFPIDRKALADRLEFDEPVEHARDAMWAPDVALDAMWAATSAFVTIDRLAEELQIWTTSEFGFFTIADRHARTSVIMPQKKNPYGLAMIRNHARQQLGRLTSVVSTNLTPSGQPDNRIYAYGAVPKSLDLLAGSADLLAEHLELGDFDQSRLERAANEGFMTATEVCDWMTIEFGVTNRNAHALVGRAIREASTRNESEITLADLQLAAKELSIDCPPIPGDRLKQVQDPRHLLSHRIGTGSIADVDAMIQSLTDRLGNVPEPRFSGFEHRFIASVAANIEQGRTVAD